jgi:hypothetical protein
LTELPGVVKDDTLVALLSKGRISGYMSGTQKSRPEQGVEQAQVNSQTLSDTAPVLVEDDKSLLGIDESIAITPVCLVIRMDNDNCGPQARIGYHHIELDGGIVLHG